ncbi:MAG: hypothetical protein NQ127_03385 [Candidatus Cardinium sp.]|nr:hypothetical protein [Candidatus Cardinium sp.]
MLREAAVNARASADQLAADAHITLAALSEARQGLFEVSATHLPTKKLVRVVGPMTYYNIK